MRYIISAIHTNSGKTFVSAVLLAGLNYDYWKPIQTGMDEGLSDTQWLKNIFGETIVFHLERYVLGLPASPNIAAAKERVSIELNDFQIPESQNGLLIEGAGGLLVPLNERHLMIDLFETFQAPLVLVANPYLGAINHTLLSVEVLNKRKIPIHGIIFNQIEDREAIRTIEHFSGVKNLGFIPHIHHTDKFLLKQAFHQYLSGF